MEANGLDFYEKSSISNKRNCSDKSKKEDFLTPNFELKLNKQNDENEVNKMNKEKNDKKIVSEFKIYEDNKPKKLSFEKVILEELSTKNTKNNESNIHSNNFDKSENWDSVNQSKSKKRVSFNEKESIHTYSLDGKRKSNQNLMKILKSKKNKNIKSILKKNTSNKEDLKKENFDNLNITNPEYKNYNTCNNSKINGLDQMKEVITSTLLLV